ncbi:hypothetical protein MC885_019765, partial [Smutsia gigantea]
PGAGLREGAELFPASPEAPLALRWEPSRRAGRGRRRCWKKRGEGGGGRRGTDPGAGRRRNTPLRPLSLLRAPVPGPRRCSLLRPSNGFSSQREEAPGRSWGGGPPCRPGARERRIRRGGPRLGWRRPLPGERRLRQKIDHAFLGNQCFFLLVAEGKAPCLCQATARTG